MPRLLGLLFLLAMGAACGPATVPGPDNKQYDYYPLVPGAWYIYKVDSIDYNQRPYDTLRFWIKEEVKPDFESIDGDEYFQIAVFKKYRWEANWQRLRTDLARVTDDHAKRYSENVFYLKQVYPIKTGLEWNATPHNETGSLYGENVKFDKATFVKIHDYQVIDGRGYDSTLHINYALLYDLINKVDFRERYANHIGLYKKFEFNAVFQPIDPGSQDCTRVNYVPNSGYKYIQTLTNHYIPK